MVINVYFDHYDFSVGITYFPEVDAFQIKPLPFFGIEILLSPEEDGEE